MYTNPGFRTDRLGTKKSLARFPLDSFPWSAIKTVPGTPKLEPA